MGGEDEAGWKNNIIGKNKVRTRHPEFISGSILNCVGIMKQVQDDEVTGNLVIAINR